MRLFGRRAFFGAAGIVLFCATASFVVAQSKKEKPAAAPKAMSVEEARKVAASTKKNFATPPRSIDDIAKVLDQNKPDPVKIANLKKTVDTPLPANSSGMAKADFLMARGLAARDLGRTQQRVTDLCEAYEAAKPWVFRKSSIYVVDFPTPSNPDGSAAFQAYMNAKRAAKREAAQASGGPRPAGGGGGRSGCNRDRNPDCGYGGGGGGGGGGGRNLDIMPKSPQEAKSRFNERVSDEQQRAIRIWQACIGAQADAGNFRKASTVFEEGRPYVITVMTGAAMNTDIRLTTIRLRAGDIEGARRVLARTQQLASVSRQHSFLSANWNNQASVIEHGIGEIALATGKPAEAETRFRNAIRLNEASIKDVPLWPQAPIPGQIETNIAITRLQMAQSMQKQGKLIEAEVETRRALVDFLRIQGVDGPKTAHTVLILADLLQAQGRYKDAQRLAEAALDIYERAGVEKALHADALQRIAVGQASQGKWKAAMATYDKLKAAVAHDEIARGRYMEVNLDLAVALLRSGQPDAAIPIFTSVVRKRVAEGGDNEYAVAEARGFLGSALAAAGRDEEALTILRASLPVLLTASDAAAKEEGAIDDQNRRQMIVDGYFGLLAKIRGSDLEKKANIDATDETFRMADVAHAQSVHSAIAATSARAASGQGALAELIRQTQDTDQQIAALSDMLKATLDIPRDQQDPKALEQLRKDVSQLKTARATLRREIERQFPQYAQLINPKPVGLAEARGKLKGGDALIVTYFSEGRGYVWAVPAQGEVAFGSIGMSESDTVAAVDTLLKSVNSSAAGVDDIQPFDVGLAHKLYAALLEPVAAGWNDAKEIIVVPHGALGRLPFSLLVTGNVAQPVEQQVKGLFAGYRDVPFLIKAKAVSHLPSVSALMSLRSMQAGAQSRKPFIGFGDPLFSAEQAQRAQAQATIQVAMRGGQALRLRSSPNTGSMMSAELAQLPRLPDTAVEVLEIARALGADQDNDVILGVKASEENVRTMKLDDRRVVMFATHGLVPGELDGLTQPALALSSPDIPGVKGDGLLTVEKILGLKLDADWVVLSACNTAAGEGGGAEAVSGLGRAFFYAGARALLVTHWPVETAAARELTTDLFKRQAANPQLDRSAALREAMVEMLERGERVDAATRQPIFAYAHPMFWSPFALIGEGGGARN
ncbi:MAG TPA: CHAT domain-containing tetratricopeptide repeat protein [Pseudorhodoplanes sp.]|nr:CHAT domain-containing tetratricopeptide repeat protein [Pseudorhodoplanes sp.]